MLKFLNLLDIHDMLKLLHLLDIHVMFNSFHLMDINDMFSFLHSLVSPGNEKTYFYSSFPVTKYCNCIIFRNPVAVFDAEI